MRRTLATGVLAALVAWGLAACGVAENREPHAIPSEKIGEGLLEANPSTSTTQASPTEQAVTVYYLVQQDGAVRLVGVTRDVTDAGRPRDRINALLAPPSPDEARAGILTSIPADTELLDTELTPDGVLTVDLSSSLFEIQGQELRNAFAQLVWTATEHPNVARVRFRVEGEEVRAPDQTGVEQPGAVSRDHYAGLAPI